MMSYALFYISGVVAVPWLGSFLWRYRGKIVAALFGDAVPARAGGLRPEPLAASQPDGAHPYRGERA